MSFFPIHSTQETVESSSILFSQQRSQHPSVHASAPTDNFSPSCLDSNSPLSTLNWQLYWTTDSAVPLTPHLKNNHGWHSNSQSPLFSHSIQSQDEGHGNNIVTDQSQTSSKELLKSLMTCFLLTNAASQNDFRSMFRVMIS